MAGALFAGVFALRLAVSGAGEAVGVLFVLPIALMAIRFGAGAGLAASVLALGLTGAWVVAQDVQLGALGWVSRAVAFGLLGGSLGWYASRLRATDAQRARAEQVGRLLQVTDPALSSLPLQEQLAALLSRVCEALAADAAALLLADSPADALVLRATHGLSRPAADIAKLLPDIGLAARVTRERRPVVLTGAEVSQLRVSALQEMSVVAGTPIFAGSRVSGVLEVGRHRAGGFDSDELELLQLAADRTALAIDHTRVFERERHIATTLQRSLLPAHLPEIPGVEVETRFMPAGPGQEVGGDFYDVFALGDDRWLMVIGDVCGKGVDAAALTAMVRYTLRAEASHDRTPAELLRLLNQAMIHQRADRRRAGDYSFCTLVCLLLDSTERVLTMAGGGHPMPLIIRAGGEILPPPHPGGPLVGAWSDAEFHERAYRLHTGDVVVAYTDGLLEAHAPEKILAPEDLTELASDCHQQALEMCIRDLEGAALGSSIEPVRDDIAILALKIEPHAPPETSEKATTAPVPPVTASPPEG